MPSEKSMEVAKTVRIVISQSVPQNIIHIIFNKTQGYLY